MLKPADASQDVEEWPTRAGANGSLRFPSECGHGCNAGMSAFCALCMLCFPQQHRQPNVLPRLHLPQSACSVSIRCAHAGLDGAVKYLEPIKEQCPNVSWADLMQMASAVAVEVGGRMCVP